MRFTYTPLLAALACWLGWSAPVGAAEFPYVNDFSGSGANVDFPTESGGNTPWAVSGGTYNIVDSVGSTQENAFATIPVTSRSPSGFVQSTQFTVNSTTGATPNFFTVGFATLSNSAGLSGTYYLADFDFLDDSVEGGRLRILSQGGTNTGFTQGSNNDAVDPAALVVGTTYTLRLVGTYGTGGRLDMTVGLFDATGTTQIGSSVTASDLSPLVGDHFGYRNAAAAILNTFTYEVHFDNFAVVPEPATAALACLIIPLACRRRRNHRAS